MHELPSEFATDLMDEPHVEGRRVPLFGLLRLLTGANPSEYPQVSEYFDLDPAVIEAAVEYGLDHESEAHKYHYERNQAISRLRDVVMDHRPDPATLEQDSESGTWWFYIDEGVPRPVADKLRDKGHKAAAVGRVVGEGLDLGDDVLPLAQNNRAILVTSHLRYFDRFHTNWRTGIIGIGVRAMHPDVIVGGLDQITRAYPGQKRLYAYELLEDWFEKRSHGVTPMANPYE